TPVASARVTTGSAGAGLTVSAWVKPAAAQKAVLFSWGAVTLELVDGQLVARVDKTSVIAAAPPAGEWPEIGVSVSDRLVLYLNGAAVASQQAALVAPTGDMVLGQNFRGELDAVEVASTARSGDWFKLLAAQGANGHLLVYNDAETTEDTG